MTTASNIRYTANGTSFTLLISFRKKRIDSKANKKAAINPTMKKGKASRVKYCQFLIKESALAPAMIGTAIMNVRSAAAR